MLALQIRWKCRLFNRHLLSRPRQKRKLDRIVTDSTDLPATSVRPVAAQYTRQNRSRSLRVARRTNQRLNETRLFKRAVSEVLTPTRQSCRSISVSFGVASIQ